MEDSGSDEIKANFEKQLLELEILQNIFANSNELVIEDEDAVRKVKEFLDSSSENLTIPRCNLGFVIKFNADCKDKMTDEYYQIQLEIICRLPKLYPLKTHPDVFIRTLSISKNLNKRFSQDLATYVKESHSFDCSILNIIEWVKENIENYIAIDANGDTAGNTTNGSDTSTDNGKVRFSRMFVYSHHIFSVEKRRSVVQIARDIGVNGFIMPGKPGVICVEGEESDVEEFWARLRNIPWQKLQMKDFTTVEIEREFVDTLRKFSNFEEKIFKVNDTTVDIGAFFIFLKQNGLESIFNLYFGVDGKLPQQTP